MAFRFSYQKLLEQRGRLRDEAARDFAKAQGELDLEKEKLEKLYDQTTEAMQFRFSTERGGGSPDLMQSVDLFTQGQKLRIEDQKRTVTKHQGIVEAKQDALREAALQFKIIERLKEKKREEYREEQRILEAKELDEITMMRTNWGKTDS